MLQVSVVRASFHLSELSQNSHQSSHRYLHSSYNFIMVFSSSAISIVAVDAICLAQIMIQSSKHIDRSSTCNVNLKRYTDPAFVQERDPTSVLIVGKRSLSSAILCSTTGTYTLKRSGSNVR